MFVVFGGSLAVAIDSNALFCMQTILWDSECGLCTHVA